MSFSGFVGAINRKVPAPDEFVIPSCWLNEGGAGMIPHNRLGRCGLSKTERFIAVKRIRTVPSNRRQINWLNGIHHGSKTVIYRHWPSQDFGRPNNPVSTQSQDRHQWPQLLRLFSEHAAAKYGATAFADCENGQQLRRIH